LPRLKLLGKLSFIANFISNHNLKGSFEGFALPPNIAYQGFDPLDGNFAVSYFGH